MAAPKKKPPRSWRIDDLQDLGRREGVTYLKAVPVLILEKWVLGERKKDEANYVWTKPLARRLERCELVPPFKSKGTGNIFGSLTSIQRSRNLTRPHLIKSEGEGRFKITLPHYELLLQDYSQLYCEEHSDDYGKLFSEGEPEWGFPTPPKERVERKEAKPVSLELEREIHNLLAPLEQALRNRQQAVERLTEENQKLQAELAALQAPEMRITDEELRNDCAELLENRKYYIDAIRRASVVLEERLRKAVGASEMYGASLVRYALNKDTGRLVISDHENEQDGVHQLFSGAFAFVRNPPAHKKLQYTELEARGAVALIDYLLSLLRQAKPRDQSV